MKISILGTNGFLSTAIAKYANQTKWELDVYGLDEPISHTCNQFYMVDLMKASLDCRTLLSSDIIIYAIGAGIQSNLRESSELIYKLNVSAPVWICNQLKEMGYQGTFVTFGSVFEMGETREERFFTEEDILTSCCPAPNDYVVSKRMLSRFVDSYRHDFMHWHFIIPTIYGAGENPRRLIPYTVNAIRKGEPLSFTAGDQVRQYVHVSEVPRLLELSVAKNLPSGVYNIEGKDTLTVREIVKTIHQVMGKDMPDGCFGTAQRTDVGMKYLALDGSKLRAMTGFEVTLPITEAIKTY